MPRPNLNSHILKITGLFGGLQIVGILCSVIRSKCVALWIGASGVGLFGLFNSALEILYAISQLSMRQSAVSDIASATTNEGRARIIRAMRRLSLWLGIIGALFTLVCCRWLSELTFGNGDYWWGFACLSISVLLSSLNNGEAAVFQGLQRFKKLAWCTMLGSVGGLLVSIPMFYIWRINSIVPSILAYIVMTWIAMGLYRERVDRDNQSMSVAQTLALGKRFLSLGAFITVTSIVSNAINYIFLSYLNRCYSVEIAGYYNAGFTLVNRYAGLIFSAIAMEYFPRLASVARSNHRTSLFVTNQLQLTVAILLPVVTLFIAFSKVITHLLYIEEFTVIVPFVVWAMVGTLFRAISWSMSFVIVARSDGRVFLCTELLSCAFSIGINILAYNKFGFAGLGVAYILWYMFYTVVVATVYFRRYHLHLNVNCLRVSAYALLPAIAAAVTASLVNPLWALPIAIGSCVMSFYLVKRKLG